MTPNKSILQKIRLFNSSLVNTTIDSSFSLNNFIEDLKNVDDKKIKKEGLVLLGKILKNVNQNYDDDQNKSEIIGMEDIKNISNLLLEMEEFEAAIDILEIIYLKNKEKWRNHFNQTNILVKLKIFLNNISSNSSIPKNQKTALFNSLNKLYNTTLPKTY